MDFTHSDRLWQPFLAATLLTQYFARYEAKVRARLSDLQWRDLQASASVFAIDGRGVCPYNGFQGGVPDYYNRMSGFGSHSGGPDSVRGGASQTALLVVHAADDPLCHVSTAGRPEEFRRHPDSRVFLLRTKRGGHVGWPVGPLPWKTGWSWMTTCAADFCEAALETRGLSGSAAGK